MRLRLVTVAILLAVASRGHGRPTDPDPLDNNSSQEVVAGNLGTASRSGNSESRHEHHRELKDIQRMDQSLRSVATQLLNDTSKHEDLIRIPDEKIVTIETPMQVVHISTRVEDAVSNANKQEKDDSSKMKFGIPVNSKFGPLEIINPGHAMAMTEEEIERELAMATASTAAQKNQPTTASMLSTWIQLYPPRTTTEGNNISDEKDIQSNQIQSTLSTKSPSTTVKQNIANTKPIRKTESKSTTPIQKTTEPSVTTTKSVKNSNSSLPPNYIKISTTSTSIPIENDIDESLSTEKKSQNQYPTTSDIMTTKSTQSTKKSSAKNNVTSKPRVTVSKNTATKPPRNHSLNRVRPLSTRKPTVNKNDSVTSTSKIEKVTIKPAIVSTRNRTGSTDKPLFVTKIKASVLTDVQKTTTVASTSVKPVHALISKSNSSSSESTNVKIPSPTRVNNILKVHVKKPIEEKTKIEIQPIRVNPPVLTIEKIEDVSTDQKDNTDDEDILQNSKIDVKFDFDPEISKVEVQTESSPSTTTVATSTTKRPRASNKRKKNKNRRRKQSTTTTTTASTPVSELDDEDIITSIITDDLNLIQEVQESKIEPESKAPPSKKKKPNQQTQLQKPIGTQIYNFLSREVMPSVGVMSLVGLGLGLASYFLYPFGGVITRRNYDVEPNYKYNLDEYGGNYGVSEEEVLSKVYSGMTGGQHHETKHSSAVIGEKNSNYYRYAVPEKPMQHTRYPTSSAKNNRVIYRPVATTSYDANYRNTEFKYPDVPTTPNYYERQRQKQSNNYVSMAGKVGIGHNRQFVVGNIPKEYSTGEVENKSDPLLVQNKVDFDTQYQVSDGYNANNEPALPLAVSAVENLGNPVALVSKANEEQAAEVYQEEEIAPTAVAVEHGPRALKFSDDVTKTETSPIRKKRGILPDISSFIPLTISKIKTPRIERSSVIQVIPSKSEIEKERKEKEQEEDLSNEILDIINETSPGESDPYDKKYKIKDHSINKQYNKNLVKNSIKKESTTITAERIESSSTTTSTTIKESVDVTPLTSTTTSTTTTTTPTEPDFVDQGETTLDWTDNVKTTAKPQTPEHEEMDFFGIAKKIARIKLRLGLTILKHASEGFAKYIGQIKKRFDGEQ